MFYIFIYFYFEFIPEMANLTFQHPLLKSCNDEHNVSFKLDIKKNNL